METLRVLIADDERPARAYLRSLLKTFDHIEVVGEADNGNEALEMIRSLRPDLALLDLQMPELSGLDVVRLTPPQQMPLVAFVTAYDQFAIQAFELNAVDYMLKPVERERLQVTIERALSRLNDKDHREVENSRLRDSVRTYAELERSGIIERLPVRKRDEIYLVPASDVVSIIADGELLRITTTENQRFEINFRLKDLEVRLDPTRFIRLSRSALVNLDSVSHISPLPGGTYLISLKNGQELTSSRLQSKILRHRLLRL